MSFGEGAYYTRRMNWLKKFLPRGKQAAQLRRVPRADHPISRSSFPSGTLRTLYGLKDAGYEAYVVGGGVRDLLVGMEPKDFDIATDAHPDEVKRVFRSCRLVGRRFMIAHVRFGDEITEVTTFRGAVTDSHERDDTGRILSDNEYGTLETDAFRRDFTVNALYYDIRDFSIVDLVGGLEDIAARVIRLIGDPELRYREDPVRMLRAVRIANKLKFRIDKASATPIRKLAPLLREIPAARLFDEIIKLLQCRDAEANLAGLREYGLLAHLLPAVDTAMQHAQSRDFIERALRNTAERIASEQTVSPAFLYAALLWPAVLARTRKLVDEQGEHINVAIVQASEEILAQAQRHVVIPKRFSLPMREIWSLQPRFDLKRGARPQRLLTHPRFRAAYDFVLLRAQSGEIDMAVADWWTQAQLGEGLPPMPPAEDAADAFEPATPGEAPQKRRRRRGGRNRRRSPQPAAT